MSGGEDGGFQFPGRNYPTHPSLPHAFQLLDYIGSASDATGASGVFGSFSVGGPQNRPDLRMVHHVFPQPMKVTRTYPSEASIREAQVAVGVQTGRDAQCVRREVTLEHVVAGDVKDTVS